MPTFFDSPNYDDYLPLRKTFFDADLLEDIRRKQEGEETFFDEPKPSAAGALISGAIRSGAAIAGAKVLPKVVGLIPGAGPIAKLATQVIGGISSAVVSDMAKENLAQRPSAIGQAARTMIASEQAHPGLSIAGSFVPFAPYAAASLGRSAALVRAANVERPLAQAFTGGYSEAAKKVLADELHLALKGAAIGGGVSAGLQAGMGALQGRDIWESVDPTMLLGDMAFGGVSGHAFPSQGEKLSLLRKQLISARKGIETGNPRAIGIARQIEDEWLREGGLPIRHDPVPGNPDLQLPTIPAEDQPYIVKNWLGEKMWDTSVSAKETLRSAVMQLANRKRAAGDIAGAEKLEGNVEDLLNNFINVRGAPAMAQSMIDDTSEKVWGKEWLKGMSPKTIEGLGMPLPLVGKLKKDFANYTTERATIDAILRKREQLGVEFEEFVGTLTKHEERRLAGRERNLDIRKQMAERSIAAMERTAEKLRTSGQAVLDAEDAALMAKSLKELEGGVRLANALGKEGLRFSPAEQAVFKRTGVEVLRELKKPIRTTEQLVERIERLRNLEVGRMNRTLEAIEGYRAKEYARSGERLAKQVEKQREFYARKDLKRPETLAQAKSIVAAYEADPVMGPLFKERFDWYQKGIRALRDFAVETEVMAPELADKLNLIPAYSPSAFLQHSADIFGVRKEGNLLVSVMDSGVEKLDMGSLQNLSDDIQELYRNLASSIVTRAFKNRAAKSLLEIAKEGVDPEILRLATPMEMINLPGGKDALKKMIAMPGISEEERKALGAAINATEGHKLSGEKMALSAMVNGVPQYMVADSRWASKWGRLPPAIAPEVSKWFGLLTGTRLVKMMATGINPVFFFRNPPRDFLHGFLATDTWTHSGAAKGVPVIGLIQQTIDYGDAAIEIFGRGKKSPWLERFKKAGGGMETLSQQGRMGLGEFRVAKQIHEAVPQLRALGDTLGWLNDKSELLGRLAIFKRTRRNLEIAVRDGKLTAEQADRNAAAQARRVLNFAEYGGASKVLDEFIPYFGASIQGTRGLLAGAERQGKVMFAWKLANLAAIGGGLYFANRMQNPEAYDAIPDYEKLNNFVVTTPVYRLDKEGNKRWTYYKIPKDQGQRGFLAFVESLMARHYENKEPGDAWLYAISGFKSALPIVSTTGFVPPTLSAMLGYGMNKDFWRNRDIWSGPEVEARDEITRFTSPAAIDIGATLNWSPARSDYVARTLWGKNIWTYLAGAPWRLMGEALPQKVQDEMGSFANDALKEFKGVFTSETRPSEDIELSREDKELLKGYNSMKSEYKDLFQKGEREEAEIARRMWNVRAKLTRDKAFEKFTPEQQKKVGTSYWSRYIMDEADRDRFIRDILNPRSQEERLLGFRPKKAIEVPYGS